MNESTTSDANAIGYVLLAGLCLSAGIVIGNQGRESDRVLLNTQQQQISQLQIQLSKTEAEFFGLSVGEALAMADVYSTAQVAELLGVSTSTVRTWKQRKTDILLEGTHWINEDGAVLWTQPGLDELTGIKAGATVSVSDMGRSVSHDGTQPETQDISVSQLLGRYQPLIDLLVKAISPQLLPALDKAVVAEMQSSVARPMNTIECLAILSELGLQPANPEALLDNGNLAGLLPEKSQKLGE